MPSHPLYRPPGFLLFREGIDLSAQETGGCSILKDKMILAILLKKAMFTRRFVNIMTGIKDPSGKVIVFVRDKRYPIFRIGIGKLAGPSDSLSAPGIQISSSTYQPKWTYGSKAENGKKHSITVAGNDKPSVVNIELSDFEAGQRVYEIKLPDVKSKDGASLHNRTFYYTVHAIPGA